MTRSSLARVALLAALMSGVASCGGGGIGAYCDRVRAYENAQSQVADALNPFKDWSPSERESVITAWAAATTAVAEVAPAEVRDDWKVWSEENAAVASEYEQHDFDAASVPDHESSAEDVRRGKAQYERIKNFTRDKCGETFFES